MLDTLFLFTAAIGTTIMICQFVLMLLGMGDDGGAELPEGGVGGDFDLGDVDGDFEPGEHHTSISTAADAQYQHHNSTFLFEMISFRALVSAGAFFGLAGLASRSAGHPPMMAIVIATLVGLAAMYGTYQLMRTIARLTSSGNERIDRAVGKRGSVYISIPAAGQGLGKIQLNLQNRTVEYQAITTDEETLKPGETVEVVRITGSDTVEVRRSEETISA